ncbi:MAG: GGDEF domain-containing protein [Nocardioidaceae bacterium]
MTTRQPGDPLAAAGTFSRAGTDLFRRASERVVAELGRRTTGMTWSVSRVEAGHQVHLHVRGGLIAAGETLPWEGSLCRRMVDGGAAIVADTLVDPAYADHPSATRFRGFAGMPIRGDDGSTFGMLCGVTSEPFTGDLGIDEKELELLTGLLADVLDGARLSDSAHAAERSALVLAQTDHLTGLVNRRGWDLAIDQARESLESYGDHMSVVIVDLDDFKAVNDREGHQAGDEQLRLTGRILSGLVRRDDVVARIGGDEFALLLVNCSETEADHREADIFDGLNAQGVTASTGHATATTAAEFDTLIAMADQAMYRAKTARRSAVSP